ncbi:MAG TPA: thioredoxin domain-containing protein [Candidatus Moranbacteria bacterium]|nr:thioredoxin domain-containing protein [Candidatus Moranbacteria bacterium]
MSNKMKAKNKKILIIGGATAVLLAVIFFSSGGKQEAGNFPSPLKDGKITVTASDRVQGADDAKITFVEYSDFQCPYCVKFHATMEKVMKEYDGKVRWVYRHSPLPFHKAAPKAAEAAECAGDQGKFWEYAAVLTKNSQPDGTGLAVSDLKKYVSEVGLNEQQFNECFSSGKFKEKIRLDVESGKKLGVQGTPATFMIDGTGNEQLISGAVPFEQIKTKIDEALSK